jgi:hypothetical protein
MAKKIFNGFDMEQVQALVDAVKKQPQARANFAFQEQVQAQ